MPVARQELATGVLNGKLYVIGGYDAGGNSTATVQVYNPTTDTWASAAPIPYAVNHNSAAVAGGKLYSFGAGGGVFVYNPNNNSWAAVASAHYAHGGTAAVGVIDDKIYVAGGTGTPSQRELEVYNPVTNRWTVKAPMSVPRNHTAGGVIDGKFYVAGGRVNFNSASAALEVYNPQTNTWSTRAPMPTARSGIAAAVVNQELWVFGGEVPNLHAEVEVYNPVSNRWRRLPDMPLPRHGSWASVIGNKIYIPGGGAAQGLAATNTNQIFTVSGGPSTGGAVSDFNSDGKPDYVLYNAGTQQTAVWYLNNNVYIGGAFTPTLPRWLDSGQRGGFQSRRPPRLRSVQTQYAPNGDLVFLRSHAYRQRLRSDAAQWLGTGGDRRF